MARIWASSSSFVPWYTVLVLSFLVTISVLFPEQTVLNSPSTSKSRIIACLANCHQPSLSIPMTCRQNTTATKAKRICSKILARARCPVPRSPCAASGAQLSVPASRRPVPGARPGQFLWSCPCSTLYPMVSGAHAPNAPCAVPSAWCAVSQCPASGAHAPSARFPVPSFALLVCFALLLCFAGAWCLAVQESCFCEHTHTPPQWKKAGTQIASKPKGSACNKQ